jgi:hypothetical protein
MEWDSTPVDTPEHESKLLTKSPPSQVSAMPADAITNGGVNMLLKLLGVLGVILVASCVYDCKVCHYLLGVLLVASCIYGILCLLPSGPEGDPWGDE